MTNEYIDPEERSFTCIAFPVPGIGEHFPEIFDEVLKINTLDYKTYETIQQHLIDALDKAAWVEIKGRGDNHTDMKVMRRKRISKTAWRTSTFRLGKCSPLRS